MAANLKIENPDMPKLQKSPRQVERHSNARQQKVAKLTPAEIRAANNVIQHKPSSRSQHSSYRRHARTLDGSTPPPSPHRGRTAYETQVKRSSTIPLPTPPQSPVLYYSKATNPQQRPPNFSMLRLRASLEADRLVSSTISSRRSSVSSINKPTPLPTYRGHEMTRNGSRILLQRPSQEIVGNPLSAFSRPRRSGSQPPAAMRTSSDDDHVCTHESEQKSRARSFDSISALSDAQGEGMLAPPPRNMSPVSFEANQSIKDFSVGEFERPQVTPSISTSAVEDAHVSTARPITLARTTATKANKKFRRHTLQTSADASSFASTNAIEEQMAAGFESHPTVRPLTVAVPSALSKGKEREIQSAPVRCCGKCGRYKKPYDPSEFGMAPLLEDQDAKQMVETEHKVAPELSARNPRRQKAQSGVSWPDKRAEGKIRPPVAPPGITRFASLRGYTTEGAEMVDTLEEVKTDSGVLVQDAGTDAGGQKKVPLEEPQFVDAPETPEEPSWVKFYGIKTNPHDTDSGPPTEPASENPGENANVSRVEPGAENRQINGIKDASDFSSDSEPDSRNKAKLPRPVLGVRFARSNLTLREYVLPKGQSHTNLLDLASGVTHSDHEQERPSTAPNRATVMGNIDGDIARGLEMSKSVDALREANARKAAEIMAV